MVTRQGDNQSMIGYMSHLKQFQQWISRLMLDNMSYFRKYSQSKILVVSQDGRGGQVLSSMERF